MSTVVAEPTAPVGADAPVDLSQVFYGSPSSTPMDTQPETQPTSPPDAEPGLAAPPQETAAPAAEVKPDPSTEAKEENAKDEDGHRQAARRLGKQVHELQAQLDQLAEDNRVLKAKVEGTYEEPQGPTPEQLQARAVFEGRELASRELAAQKYGEDKVMERIYSKGSELHQVLKQQPWNERRIAESLQPTIEAWIILEEQVFRNKYGTDPSQWAAKILMDAKPALLEEFRKTLSASVVGTSAPSVTQARGGGSPDKRERSISELFYGKTTQPT